MAASADGLRIDRVELIQRKKQLKNESKGRQAGDSAYLFLVRIHGSHNGQVIVERCGWPAKTGWRPLVQAAEMLQGVEIPLSGGPDATQAAISEIAQALGSTKLIKKRVDALVGTLERMVERVRAGQMENMEELEFLVKAIRRVVQYHVVPAVQPGEPAYQSDEPRLTINQVQAIQYRAPESARTKAPEFVYLLQLRANMQPGGASIEIPVRWRADSGWPRVEHVIPQLVGQQFPLRKSSVLATLQTFMQGIEEAGFPRSGLAALGRGIGELLLTALGAPVRSPEPLAYADILPEVNRYACFPEPPTPTWGGKTMNIYEGVTYLHPLGGNGAKGHLLERQALAYGLSTLRYNKGTFLASDGKKEALNFKWSRSPISSGVALALCTHKEATRARLSRAGVPVPRGRMFVNGDFESAYLYADRIGYPVVCKPAAGVRGIGVVANIQNREELQEAFRQMTASRLGGDDFIVEKHVPGRDYRIIVLDDQVIAAILREPASVIGDGKRNVAELVMHKNAIRRLNPHLWARPAKYDEAMKFQLQRAGLELHSVPEEGKVVMLSNTCSLSQGGDSIDILDELHPTIRDAAVAAVKAIPGLRYCGVDFLIEDHTKPIEGQAAGICELNAHAAIGNCEYPLFGEPREVARAFLHTCARQYGLEISDQPAEKLAIHITVRGRVTKVGYRRWLKAQADRFGVRGWVRNVSSRCVEAVLEGDTAPVSAMASGAVLGPSKAFPTSVHVEHVTWADLEGFEIKRGYVKRKAQ